MNNIRYEVSQGGCLNVPQNCLKVPRVYPESVSRCPHLFQAHIVTATSLATGICSIQILIVARSTLSSGT